MVIQMLLPVGGSTSEQGHKHGGSGEGKNFFAVFAVTSLSWSQLLGTLPRG